MLGQNKMMNRSALQAFVVDLIAYPHSNEPKGTSMLINVKPALLVLLIYLIVTLPENVQVYFGAHI